MLVRYCDTKGCGIHANITEYTPYALPNEWLRLEVKIQIGYGNFSNLGLSICPQCIIDRNLEDIKNRDVPTEPSEIETFMEFIVEAVRERVLSEL